uniref:Uncharacterized protein n=1 Tax=viral metagenome TaxID=1070528 RepID=A0A6C0HMB3_9ZZZZ
MINHKLTDANKSIIYAIIVLIVLAFICHISNWIWGKEKFYNTMGGSSSCGCSGNSVITLPAGFAPPQNTKYTNISYWSYPDNVLQENCSKNSTPKPTLCSNGAQSTLDNATKGLLYKTMYNRAGLEVMSRHFM